MRANPEGVVHDIIGIGQIDVRRQVANYKRFKELCAQRVALGIEHSKLKIKLKPKDNWPRLLHRCQLSRHNTGPEVHTLELSWSMRFWLMSKPKTERFCTEFNCKRGRPT